MCRIDSRRISREDDGRRYERSSGGEVVARVWRGGSENPRANALLSAGKRMCAGQCLSRGSGGDHGGAEGRWDDGDVEVEATGRLKVWSVSVSGLCRECELSSNPRRRKSTIFSRVHPGKTVRGVSKQGSSSLLPRSDICGLLATVRPGRSTLANGGMRSRSSIFDEHTSRGGRRRQYVVPEQQSIHRVGCLENSVHMNQGERHRIYVMKLGLELRL